MHMPAVATVAMEAMAKVMGKGSGSVSMVEVGVELVSWVGCVGAGGKVTIFVGISRVEIACGALSKMVVLVVFVYVIRRVAC